MVDNSTRIPDKNIKAWYTVIKESMRKNKNKTPKKL